MCDRFSLTGLIPTRVVIERHKGRKHFFLKKEALSYAASVNDNAGCYPLGNQAQLLCFFEKSYRCANAAWHQSVR